ncbi:MAG: TonB-dependent receptor, partial [Pseudomonadota bacterium]
ELLRSMPSTNISASGPIGSLTEIRFRGSESNHVLVTVDGVEINDSALGGVTNFAHLLTDNVERIEVLKGPQSALWGSAAVSGIINIVTRQPGKQQQSANIGLRVGNHSTLSANGFYAFSSDDLDLNVGASHLSTNGENIARGGGEDDGYRNSNIFGKLSYVVDKTNTINATINYLDYRNEFDGTNFTTGLPTDQNFETEGSRLTASIDWAFQPEKSMYSQYVILQYTDNENLNLTFPNADTSSTGEKLRIVWNNQFVINPLSQINLSYERIEEDLKQTGVASAFGDPNQTQSTSTDAFLFDSIFGFPSSEDVTFNANYRYDNNDDFDNASSFRLAAQWQINDTITAFISRGKAIKNPSFTERFGFSPNTFTGNPDLEPEVSFSSEIGAKIALANLDVEISYFDTKLEDEILGFVFIPETFGFTADNAEVTSEQQGVELVVSGEQGNLSWQASYAYLDASENNVDELRRAEHAASFSVNYALDSFQNIYVQADYTGSRSDRFFPSEPPTPRTLKLDSYWLVNVNYRYLYTDALTLNAKVNNLFDSSFEDVIGFQGGGISIQVGASYTF